MRMRGRPRCLSADGSEQPLFESSSLMRLTGIVISVSMYKFHQCFTNVCNAHKI